MDHSFPEPRGWALNWEGTALFPDADPVTRVAGAREAKGPDGALRWHQVTAPRRSQYRNGNGRNGLTRPLGWALNWDGAALVEITNPDEPLSQQVTGLEKEGTV